MDKRPKTAEQLAGRIIVIEGLAMMALAMLARKPAERSPTEMIECLNATKSAIRARLIQEGIGGKGAEEAQRYQDEVFSQFSETLIPKKP